MGPIYGSSIYLRKIYAALRACRIVIVRKKRERDGAINFVKI